MENLLILAALFGAVSLFATPVMAFLALRRVGRLTARIDALERGGAVEPGGTVERGGAVGEGEAVPAAREVARKAPWAMPDVASVAPRVLPVDGPPASPIRSGPSLVDRGLAWLSVNWFYAVAAASLALAGVFLVQYGAERGLLPPGARVAAALAFGAVLIGAGEWVRRRFGDGEGVATAYLPSVMSGAGIVTLFAAILGARHLYGLIGAEAALAGLIAVGLGAIVLGWFHGPLLVAVGLIGGAGAPFVVGGNGTEVAPLHAYFALLALVGLAVDGWRRWRGRWVSGLALVCGIGGSALLVAFEPGSAPSHLMALLAIAFGAMTLPVARLRPVQARPTVLEAAVAKVRPPLVNAVALAAVAAVVALTVLSAPSALWWAVGALVALFALLAVWADRAAGLQDAALLPPAGLLAVIWLVPIPLEAGPWVTLMLGAGAAMSGAAFRRSLRLETATVPWSLAAALIAPLTGLMLDVAWGAPGAVGSYGWALHALAVAAGLTGMALLWAARDGEDRLRTSLAALAAFTLIGYALGQVAGPAALTASIGLMAGLAAWLDRRFDLPLLGGFVVLAAPFVGWRLTVDPGIDWHVYASLGPVLLSMLGPLAGFEAARRWLRGRDRHVAQAVAETAAMSVAGYAATILLWRGLEALGWDDALVEAGLTSVIWLTLAVAQVELRARGGSLPRVRLGLAVLFATVGGGALVSAVTFLSPLLYGTTVLGPPVLNSLIPGYLLPGLLLLAAGAWRRSRLVAGLGAAVTGLWAVLAIRHFWRGAEGMGVDAGVSQAELTTYTFALLILGGALFYQGVAKRSAVWRRAGTIVLGVTVAKVFLVDAARLDGLLRVGAFVGLAFALAGLAWLYRWAGSGDEPGVAEGAAD